ncbi:MAG: aldo/keto reductase [Candidatus Marinimicrobia bacterium]|nr:aldo/keto reductase [Candidatus Neomarinimicrobiota bacterium]MCF7903944.1 aldo/keto reductase [Candidatus Neomarinimicrobiota bacterium]
MINKITDKTHLNNGVDMPWLGFGVFQIKDGQPVEQAVKTALGVGYRSIDTAAVYKNERGVGKAIRESGVSRDEIFLTTKLWNEDQRQHRVQAAFDESLKRLGVDYVDLYLVHWPVKDHYQNTWPEMEQIYNSGRAKAIGVSNFMVHHLDDILPGCDVVPATNQIEFHPHLVQPELLEHCEKYDIRVEAWSPLMKGEVVNISVIQGLAEKYGKTPAQITLRWDVQHGVVTIPKSELAERIAENAGIFDFELDQEDMGLLDRLDQGKRIGPDPDNFNF